MWYLHLFRRGPVGGGGSVKGVEGEKVIDEERVQRMASRYEMNPQMARKLLELARAEPEIMRLSKRYRRLKEGDTVGNQDDQEASG